MSRMVWIRVVNDDAGVPVEWYFDGVLMYEQMRLW